MLLATQIRINSIPKGKAKSMATEVTVPVLGESITEATIGQWLKKPGEAVAADEPIASLDPMNAQVVMDALRRIHEEDGRMVIANLHTLDTARRYCDRVIGMRDGRVVFDGTPDQLSTGVARDIYGADDTFNEAATSTAIPTDTVADRSYADTLMS